MFSNRLFILLKVFRYITYLNNTPPFSTQASEAFTHGRADSWSSRQVAAFLLSEQLSLETEIRERKKNELFDI